MSFNPNPMFKASILVFILNLFKGYNTFSRPYIISVVGVVRVRMNNVKTIIINLMIIIRLFKNPNGRNSKNNMNSIILRLLNISKYNLYGILEFNIINVIKTIEPIIIISNDIKIIKIINSKSIILDIGFILCIFEEVL